MIIMGTFIEHELVSTLYINRMPQFHLFELFGPILLQSFYLDFLKSTWINIFRDKIGKYMWFNMVHFAFEILITLRCLHGSSAFWENCKLLARCMTYIFVKFHCSNVSNEKFNHILPYLLFFGMNCMMKWDHRKL